MKKFIKRTILSLVAIIFIVFVIIILGISSIATSTIQKVGPNVLGVPITIESLKIKPFSGTVDLHGFRLHAPENYDHDHTLSVDQVYISLDTRSLFSDTIRIHEIRIEEPQFTFEKSPKSDNITDIIKSIKAFAPSKKEKKNTKAPTTSTPKIILEKFILNKLLCSVQLTDNPTLGTALSIDTITFSTLTGQLAIDGIAIKNPGSLTEPNLFTLPNISLTIDPNTLFSNQPFIKTIRINSPSLFLEKTDTTDTIMELTKLAEALTPQNNDDISPKEAEPSTEKPQPIRIGSIRINNTQLKTFNVKAQTNSTTTASIENISAFPEKGKLLIKNIVLANPPEFAHSNLLTLSSFEVIADPATYSNDTLIIRNVAINHPTIAYEKTLTTNNMAAFQQQISSNTKKNQAKEAEQEDAKKQKGQKIIIEHLLIKDGKVKPKISALPTLPIPLADIELKDIGKENGGASFKEILTSTGKIIYKTIMKAITGLTGIAGDVISGAGNVTLETGKATLKTTGKIIGGTTDLTVGTGKKVLNKASSTLKGTKKLTTGTIKRLGKLIPRKGKETEKEEAKYPAEEAEKPTDLNKEAMPDSKEK